MKKFMIGIVVVSFVAAATLFPAFSFASQTYNVSSASDLISAMSSASDGDTINLTSDIQLNTPDSTHPNDDIFYIRKNITINGNNHKIYAQDGFRHPSGDTLCFLEKSGGTVTFNNLTLAWEGSETIDYGITTYGAALSGLVFNSCTFANTQIGITIRGDLTVDNCTFNTVYNGLQDDFGGLTSNWQVTNSVFNGEGNAVQASSHTLTKFTGNTLNDSTTYMSISNANGADLSGNIANSVTNEDPYLYFMCEIAKDGADISWTFNTADGAVPYYFYDPEAGSDYKERVSGTTHTLTLHDYFAISKLVEPSDSGSFTVSVEGDEVSDAIAGSTVTLTPSANPNYTLDYFAATSASGDIEIQSVPESDIGEATFVMPSEDVEVTAHFKSASVKKSYEMLEGSDVVIDLSNAQDVVFRSKAEFSKFVNVTVDEIELVRDTDYVASEGSTIVTVKADYFKTLNGGAHELSINSTDGSAKTTFTITNSADLVGGAASDTKDILAFSFLCLVTAGLFIAYFVFRFKSSK